MVDKDIRVIPGVHLPVRRIGKITTLTGITRELSMVYKQVMRGEIPPDIGTKAAYMLNIQAGVVEKAKLMEELEERLQALETV